MAYENALRILENIEIIGFRNISNLSSLGDLSETSRLYVIKDSNNGNILYFGPSHKIFLKVLKNHCFSEGLGIGSKFYFSDRCEILTYAVPDLDTLMALGVLLKNHLINQGYTLLNEAFEELYDN